MVDVGSLSKGMYIKVEGEIYRVVDVNKHFRARGSGLIRTKLKSISTGLIREINFNSGEKVEEADITFKKASYIYNDGEMYYFMDNETFEQYGIPLHEIEEEKNYLVENTEVDLIMHDGKPIGIQLPTSVVLEVVETEPGFKGDTVSGGGKPAVLETGLKITVPFFVEVGQKVRVDTRTGKYIERA
ncbi:elongation factor P [Thermosipho atlanticus]|uniref:Elongation factor P n=1 Tax=Thermosipho atlanticus DSM 15807 TaxID=1123380 RepID=A0A1M5TR11_9BACT|nr:elongation factor P [Thermosipho atlanticus]SHH52833.1 translation elongation factor P (EF-P) [Thermosipho atlanticus DSM 15807]